MNYLNRMRIINWHLYRDNTIPFGKGVTVISAPNKTGKSTIADALRYGLLGETRFNSAARNAGEGGRKRNLVSYVRGLITDDGHEYYRPESSCRVVTSHIVLEYYDEDSDSCFILGTMIESGRITDPPRTERYVMDRARLEDVPCRYEEDGKTFIADMRTFQKMTGVKLLSGSDGLDKFMRVIGMHIEMRSAFPEYKRRMNNLFSSRSESISVHDFIREHVLPEKPIASLTDLKENRQMIEEINRQLDGLTREVEQLDRILEQFGIIDDAEEKLLRNDILTDYHSLREIENDMASLTDRIRTAQNRLDDAGRQEDGLQEERLALEDRRGELKDSLSDNDISRSIDRERNNIESLELRKKTLLAEKDRLDGLQELVRKLPETFPELAETIEGSEILGRLGDRDIDAAEKKTAIDDLKESLRQVRDDYYHRFMEKRAEHQKTLDDLSATKQLIEEYKNYRMDRNAPWCRDHFRLCDAINAELKRQGRDPRARLAYEDVAGLTDESWRDALEGFLGSRRYTVIVDPDDYDTADDVFIRMRDRGKAHLFNTRRMAEKQIQVEPDSVVKYLDITDPVTRQYFEYQLGRMREAGETDVKNHDYAIAKSGKTSRNLDNYYAGSDSGRIRYCLGAEAFEKNREEAEKEYAVLTVTAEGLRREEGELENLYRRASEKLDGFTEYDYDVNSRIDAADGEIARANSHIDALKESLSTDRVHMRLQEELEETESKIKLNAEMRRQIAGLIDSLSHDLSRYRSDHGDDENKLKYAREKMDRHNSAHPDLTAAYTREYDDPDKKARPWKREAHTAETYQARIRDATGEGISQMHLYRSEFESSLPVDMTDNARDAYAARKEKIEVKDMRKIQENLNQKVAVQEQIFKNEFVHAILRNCDDAESMFSELNMELNTYPFGDTTYQFTWNMRKNDGSAYSTILRYAERIRAEADSYGGPETGGETEDGPGGIDGVIREITSGSEAEMDAYADYRMYMDYDISITNQVLNHKSLTKQSSSNSGAEMEIPYTVMLLAGIIAMYNETSRTASRLAILDEPFKTMDPGRVRQMLEFMKFQNLQVILCEPMKEAAFCELADTVVTIVRVENQLRIVPLSGKDFADGEIEVLHTSFEEE